MQRVIEEAVNMQDFKRIISTISHRDIRKICVHTKAQSKSKEWFRYRKAMCTSTITKRLITAIEKDENNDSWNKAITKDSNWGFTCPAMQWGVLYEPVAIQELWEYFRKGHVAAQKDAAGICIDADIKILCASPDHIFSCMCCGQGERYYYSVEVKCPYSLREEGIQASDKLGYLAPLLLPSLYGLWG